MQPCPGAIGDWTSWSNCDRSCDAGVRIRSRKCFDSQTGDELDAGLCTEDEEWIFRNDSDWLEYGRVHLKIFLSERSKCVI